MKHLLFHAALWKTNLHNSWTKTRKLREKVGNDPWEEPCEAVHSVLCGSPLVYCCLPTGLVITGLECSHFSSLLAAEKQRGQHANWCCGTENVKASRPQAGVYAAPLPGIPSDLLPSQQPFPVSAWGAGYYPCVCGKLCTVRDESEEKEVSVEQRRERGSWPCSPQTSSVSLLYLSLMTACVNRGQQH